MNITYLSSVAQHILLAHKETYIAQWVLQNPHKHIENYSMCHQIVDGVSKFWMEEI